MPDQNSTGDKVKFCRDKTPSCSKPHQGLFLKQISKLKFFFSCVFHKVSSSFYFHATHVLSSTG